MAQNGTGDVESCSICLHTYKDRAIVPTCSHEFCFGCILEWSEQSSKCPLCNQIIGDYLIHRFRGRYDYQKHYLVKRDMANPTPGPSRQQRRERRYREEVDRLEESIEKRRAIYYWGLYAKHVASNMFTKYRPYPSPQNFAASDDMVRRTTSFLRRELRIWPNLDVEFLTTFTISIMKSIDIRSESAVKLISEFLDPDGGKDNAEHFAHEVYSYVRSPYRDLFVYDTVVQYDEPPERDVRWHGPRSRTTTPSPEPSVSPPRRARRPRSPSPVRPSVRRRSSPSPARSDISWSPSGRIYTHTGVQDDSPPPTPVPAPQLAQQHRARSPPSHSLSPSSPSVCSTVEELVPKPAQIVEPTPLVPRTQSLVGHPKRPLRSALESVHAHLGFANSRLSTQKGPSTPLVVTEQPEPCNSKQAEIRRRLLALKADTTQTQEDRTPEQTIDSVGSERERNLRLRARLAAEKRRATCAPESLHGL
ncbi:hypothetical protein CYLTODRAFT_160952 [Cylindrobasidium torrendii FP15055 ss-10]|uniref:RING-type E3 ubiquitin transferase n=1 Tax=Cylindrobasidium torrendii FP15055 ss-10 TaxID=1314674 RepID=A0A0D7BK50_9AGAR|nr:hypothetical protein CYLTODRAFT_160952 [Cylindrobasidium torrendii FP15055 ss-10]